ncbi:DAK2 domain-containing protein [Kroppenstedtia sanguinis]|uniref:DAK2 domain-containing protein n=1 Tax=Kroppenstedtia sanguinis TaxID=1380684 RepID=A0ABW4C7T2_9BACL
MLVRVIDSQMFLDMVRAGAKRLNGSVDQVNALNVFPVPDGDTGTNMNLTLTSGVKELEREAASNAHVGKLAEALSKGLLMGARGNSGVILSQLFRGFAKGVADQEILTSREFVEGLKRGVDTAYKAVIKPVEGTVLTVAREAAEMAVRTAHRTENLAELMERVLKESRSALQRTPEQLPVLAQAGVVDAGGQGLVRIYEGFLAALTGEEVSYTMTDADGESVDLNRLGEIAHRQSAQSHFETGDIEHGYCTEFIVQLKPDKLLETPFSEEQFRRDMARFGDSLLVVADDDLVKVHIHAEQPGDTLTYAQRYGELTRIKIDNMREQHATILDTEHQESGELASVSEKKRYGLVAVASGDGISEIFRSLGVDVVIQGGQTMNPSTEEMVQAVREIPAEHVFILPNNKNIIMTAEQVTELVEVPVTVLPTRNIPQGLAALLSFNEEANADLNQKRMMESVGDVSSGEVTYAVRDSQYEGGNIQEGDFLGIWEGRIETVGADLLATSRDLLTRMLTHGGDMVTLLYGEDVTPNQVQELTHFLAQNYPDVECEVHYGGQPLYYFLFSVE